MPHLRPSRARLVLAAALAVPCVLAPAALRAQATPPAAGTPAAGPAPSAARLALATELLEVMRSRELMRQTIERMSAQQIQQMPQLAQFSVIMRKFYEETMDWSSLGPHFARIYADLYTEAELRELMAFYRTPVGQKMLTTMPEVLARTNAVTTERVQAAMPRLMEQMREAEAAATGSKPRP